MTKTILLIRHAESANNALPEPQRVPDPGLTPLGLKQSERLAERLAGLPVSELYCSPFRRSLDTTLPSSRLLALLPNIRADIYEQGGCYSGYGPHPLRGEPGMNRRELAAAYPDWIIDPSISDLGWNAGRDYETCEEVQQRAVKVVEWLTGIWEPRSRDTMAALVIHADFKRVLLTALLQSDSWAGCEQPIWNTGISTLRLSGRHWELVDWNSVDHLPSDMRTPVINDASAA